MVWPLISIIITSYNYGHTLKLALDSACAQNYPNLEILVLDNASTDGTRTLLEKYTYDTRIRVFHNSKNIGAPANHNQGLAKSNGAFILFLSADDMLFPDSIRQAYLFTMAYPEIDIVYSPTHIMNAESQLLYRIIITGEVLGSYRGGRDELPHLLINNFVGFASVLVPRWVFERYGGINENVIALDYDLLLRWAAAGLRFGYLPQARHAYRIHDTQESGLNKFSVTGLNILERIAFMRMHLNPEQIHRIDGFEFRMSRSLSEQFETCQSLGLQNAALIAGEVQRMQSEISVHCDRNRQRPFLPKMSILVIPYEPLPAFLESLKTLMTQSLEEWEAIVLCRPGIDLLPFCQNLDLRMRIKTLQLLNPMTLGRALNQGLRLAAGNTITFLRAGLSAVPRNHLARIVENARRLPQSICIADARFMLLDTNGCATPVIEVSDRGNIAEQLCVSPCRPIESITFTQRMIDQAGYFDEELPILAEWEMLLRLSQYFPVTSINSAAMIYTVPGASPFEGNRDEYLRVLENLYTRYPTNRADLFMQREEHRRILLQTADQRPEAEDSFTWTIEQFRRYMGLNIAPQEY